MLILKFDETAIDYGEAATIPAARDAASGESGSMMAPVKTDPGPLHDALLVTRDPEVQEKVTSALHNRPPFALRTVSARVSEFESGVLEIPKAQLLILDLNTANIIETEALERIKKAAYSDTPIIAISSYLDLDTVRTLVQTKVDDWLPKDCTPADIYKACERLIRPAQIVKPSQSASCYSFMSVTGGAGCTTLAIQSAFLLGRRSKSLEKTCIVDLNFQDGVVADYLDLTPAFRVEELAATPDRLDRQLLEVMLARHSTGVAVLAAPRYPARFLEVSETLISSILGLLADSFQNIVVDLPKAWHPWTDRVILGSNKVFVITSFTVPALRQARFVSDAIIAKGAPEVSVVVNKYQERLFGSGLLRKDAEQLLGARLGGFTPDAESLVSEAINRGLPISEINSGSKLEKRLAEIVSPDGTGTKRR
jgi:pilus assembly protein CpaE